MSLLGREVPIDIYGPKGTKEVVELLLEGSKGDVGFEVRVHECGRGVVYEDSDFVVEAEEADHVVDALAYRVRERDRPGKVKVEFLESIGLPRGPLWGKLQRGQPVEYRGRVIRPEEAVGEPRRGRVVVYTGDTRPSQKIAEFASNVDLLIHEATFAEELKPKADEDGHSTAKGAAEVAKSANVRRLYLTHISPRYEGKEELLLTEARAVFQESYIAHDLERIEVTYRE